MSLKAQLVFLLGAAGLLAAQNKPSVIGDGWGLDHVMVSVRDFDAVRDVLGAKLGFSPLPGNKFPAQGLEHAIIHLPPAYLEFLWPYQEPTDATDFGVRRRIESGGGPVAYNLDVSPVEQAAGIMRNLGLRVTLPPSVATRTPDGKEQPGAWQFIGLDTQDQAAHPLGVPGGVGVGFLEYRTNTDRLKPDRFQTMRERVEQAVPDPRRAAGEINANTARKLLSVWVSVPNAAEAIKQSERFGFSARGERNIQALGEKGREVQCGQGTIVFLEAANPKSALATLVKKNGLGPFGVSVAVANLKVAQRIVQEGTKTKFSIQQTGNRLSFVVPAELAAGTYIEFVQQ